MKYCLTPLPFLFFRYAIYAMFGLSSPTAIPANVIIAWDPNSPAEKITNYRVFAAPFVINPSVLPAINSTTFPQGMIAFDSGTSIYKNISLPAGPWWFCVAAQSGGLQSSGSNVAYTNLVELPPLPTPPKNNRLSPSPITQGTNRIPEI